MMISFYRHSPRSDADRQRLYSAYSLLLLCFSLGCLISAIFGDLLGLAPFFDISNLSPDGALFFTLALYMAAFLVVALFLSSTFLGFVILPFLSFLRGYMLSLTAATIIAGYHSSGVFMALTILGIPALLAAPCFLILSSEAFLLSRRLSLFFAGRGVFTGGKLGVSCAVCIPMTAIAVFLEIYIVPYLVSLLKG